MAQLSRNNTGLSKRVWQQSYRQLVTSASTLCTQEKAQHNTMGGATLASWQRRPPENPLLTANTLL
jgi:hypothetical protein